METQNTPHDVNEDHVITVESHMSTNTSEDAATAMINQLELEKPKLEQATGNIGGNGSNGKYGPKLEEQSFELAAVDTNMFIRNTKKFTAVSGVSLPAELDAEMDMILMKLAQKGYVFRCSNDNRNSLMQKIFEFYPRKELFTNWKDRNIQVDPVLAKPTEKAFRYALWIAYKAVKNFDVKAWNEGNKWVKLFAAVRALVLLGKDLNEPIDFCIIYNKSAAENPKGLADFKSVDDRPTVDYILSAKPLGYKVYNIATKTGLEELKLLVNSDS